MNGFDLLVQMNGLDDAVVEECSQRRMAKKSRPWLRWGALAACLCLAAGLYLLPRAVSGGGNGGQIGGIWNRTIDTGISQPHREDVVSGIEPEAVEALGGSPDILWTYSLRSNEWFLNPDLTDFSQALTDRVTYIVPGGPEGTWRGEENYTIYSYYTREDDGSFHCAGTVGTKEQELPHGFAGLTRGRIEADLAGVDYEDYIVVRGGMLGAMVWARSAGGDHILTYPERPDLLGIQVGGVYTLDELCLLLAGNGDYEGYAGPKAIAESIAVYPPDRSADEIFEARTTGLDDDGIYKVEGLSGYLPDGLSDFGPLHATLYQTEMDDGTVYRMLRVSGSETFLLMVRDHEPDAAWVPIGELTEAYIDRAGGRTFHVSMGDGVWVSMNKGRLTPEEALELFRSIQN